MKVNLLMYKLVTGLLFCTYIFLFSSYFSHAQTLNTNQKQSLIKETKTININTDLGTDKSPLVVKIPLAEKSKEDFAKDEYERGEKRELDRDTVYYLKVTAFVSFFMLLVAVFQVYFFRRQLQMMKQTLQDSADNSNAATISANALQKSAEIAKRSMIASERAYVHHDGIFHYSHPTNDGGLFWRLHIRWRNCGNTPAREIKLYMNKALLNEPLPENYTFEFETPTGIQPFSLAPNGVISAGFVDINGADLLAVQKEEKFLFVWGAVTYKTVFTESGEHTTKFCVQATNVTGDPLSVWNRDLPLGIHFAVYKHHNCADDECP